MPTIKDAIQEMVDELKNVNGLRNVPDAPPEKNSQFPFATLIPVSGKFEMAGGFVTSWHDVEIHLHVQRKDLARAYDDIMPLLSDIPKQIMTGLKSRVFTGTLSWEGDITYVWEVCL